MSLLTSLLQGLRSLFRKEQVNKELDEELNGFLEMAAEEKMKQGMSRNDALRAVRLERGNLETSKEVVRSAGWESFVEICWQDLRFAARMLRKNLASRPRPFSRWLSAMARQPRSSALFMACSFAHCHTETPSSSCACGSRATTAGGWPSPTRISRM